MRHDYIEIGFQEWWVFRWLVALGSDKRFPDKQAFQRALEEAYEVGYKEGWEDRESEEFYHA